MINKIHIDTIMKQIYTEKLEILNISFREYIVLFADYFITVYPFSYSVYSYDNATIDNLKYYRCKKYDFVADWIIDDYHHFHETTKPKYLPSDVFEKVSGFLIHTNNITEYDLYDPIVCKIWKDKYYKNIIYFRDK